MINSNQCLQLLLQRFVNFRKSQSEFLKYWGNDNPGVYSDMFAFTNYVVDLLQGDENKVELKNIFDFIEYLLLEGDLDVKEAVATCFLENLINSAASTDISSLKFTHLLGKESKSYCKAWDEFSGIKTKGLWDDEFI